MSAGVRAGRGFAVGIAVVAMAAAWARLSPPAAEPWASLAILPTPVLLIASVALAAWLPRRRPGPASFDVVERGPAFHVPPSRLALGMPAILVVAAVPIGVSLIARSDEPTSLPFVVLSIVLAVLGPVLVGLGAAFVYAVWAGWPAVALTPAGLRLSVYFGTLTVPWEALRPGTPVRGDLSAPRVDLTVDRPDLVLRRGIVLTGRGVPLSYLRVNPWFLTDAIRHYATHPEHRAAIGTAAEHDRLVRAFTSGPDDRDRP